MIIQDCSKDQFMLVIKAAYGYILFDNTKEFDIMLLINLLEMGDRFGSKRMIDDVDKMLDCKISVEKYYEEIIKLFWKFSPNYDYMLTKLYRFKHTLDGLKHWDLDMKIYLATLSNEENIKVQLLKHIIKHHYNTEEEKEKNEKHVNKLLNSIEPLKLNEKQLIFMVQHKIYPAEEVVKLLISKTDKKNNNKLTYKFIKSNPLVVNRLFHIGTFINNIFSDSEVFYDTKIKSKNYLYGFYFLNKQNRLVCDKKYAIYKNENVIGFDESIYEVTFTDKDKKINVFEKEDMYKVYAILKW